MVKRRRIVLEGSDHSQVAKKMKTQNSNQFPPNSVVEIITSLESQILQSRKNYNKITKLLDYAQDSGCTDSEQECALLSLCRIFCRIHITNKLDSSTASTTNEKVVLQWLKLKLGEYSVLLFKRVQNGTIKDHTFPLDLLMQLAKEEISAASNQEEAWMKGVFAGTINALLDTNLDAQVIKDYVQSYIQPFADANLYAFRLVRYVRSVTNVQSLTRRQHNL